MAIDGLGLRSSYLGSSLVNLRGQLDNLQQQLATGKKSNTYAGLGVDRGFAMSLRAQVSSLTGYSDTINNVNVRLSLGNSVLERMNKIGTEIKSAAASANTIINNNGQVFAQGQAQNALAETLQLMNTRSGDRYLFSGRATDTGATAPIDQVMDGVGGKAGLKQVVAERRQADLGASGLGRLVVSAPTTTSIQLAEDVAGSPFGFKLSAITSSLTGANVTPPGGSPATTSVDLTANPANGEKIRFSFNLPDGTTESIELTASSETPTPLNSFAIGVDATATATNLQSSLTMQLGKLASTSLTAASAMAASDNFFGSPSQRVTGPAFGSATSLVVGTPVDTVSWYTGESGADSARGTAVARVDDSITVQYGARANEEALRWQLQNVAAYAAVTTSATDPNAGGLMQALSLRVTDNLAEQQGQQQIKDIQSDFAASQTAMKAAGDRQTQAKSMAMTMLDSIEGVSDEEVAVKIIALQTSLQASYQTTSRLYQTTLLNYL